MVYSNSDFGKCTQKQLKKHLKMTKINMVIITKNQTRQKAKAWKDSRKPVKHFDKK